MEPSLSSIALISSLICRLGLRPLYSRPQLVAVTDRQVSVAIISQRSGAVPYVRQCGGPLQRSTKWGAFFMSFEAAERSFDARISREENRKASKKSPLTYRHELDILDSRPIWHWPTLGHGTPCRIARDCAGRVGCCLGYHGRPLYPSPSRKCLHSRHVPQNRSLFSEYAMDAGSQIKPRADQRATIADWRAKARYPQTIWQLPRQRSERGQR